MPLPVWQRSAPEGVMASVRMGTLKLKSPLGAIQPIAPQ